MSSIEEDASEPDEVDLDLLIYTGELSPHAVTGALQIEPTKIIEVGKEHRRNSRTGEPLLGKVNAWFLTVANSSQEPLEVHFSKLLDLLLPVKESLAEIRRWPGLKMRIKCVLWEDAGYDFTLSPEILSGLSELGIEVGFCMR